MNKEELIMELEAVAEEDTLTLKEYGKHPCTIAIRALNQCFEDIKGLQRGLQNVPIPPDPILDLDDLSYRPYNPEW